MIDIGSSSGYGEGFGKDKETCHQVYRNEDSLKCSGIENSGKLKIIIPEYMYIL